MNPRQRRGVLLILVTILGAVVTFGAVFSYVQSVSSQVGPMTTVVKLSGDVNELQAISASNVETVEVPERWVPDGAIKDTSALDGKVAAGAYKKGDTLQASMLIDPPQLTEGYREVTIMVDSETGVAGRISPGARVDVISTTEDSENKSQNASVIIQNALITEVGVATAVQKKDGEGNFEQESEKVPVTFSLTPEESLKLAYAESFSTKVRLLLRRDGDDSSVSNPNYGSSTGAAPAGGDQ